MAAAVKAAGVRPGALAAGERSARLTKLKQWIPVSFEAEVVIVPVSFEADVAIKPGIAQLTRRSWMRFPRRLLM